VKVEENDVIKQTVSQNTLFPAPLTVVSCIKFGCARLGSGQAVWRGEYLCELEGGFATQTAVQVEWGLRRLR